MIRNGSQNDFVALQKNPLSIFPGVWSYSGLNQLLRSLLSALISFVHADMQYKATFTATPIQIYYTAALKFNTEVER